jgi:hypothetical protein
MDKPFVRWHQLNSAFRFFLIPAYVLCHIPLYIAYPGYSNYDDYYIKSLYFLGFMCIFAFFLSKTVLSELDIKRYRRGIVKFSALLIFIFLFFQSVSMMIFFGHIVEFNKPAIALLSSYVGSLFSGVIIISYFNVLGSYLRYRR